MDSEIEKLIDSALRKAVMSSGPVKLYWGKNDRNGLFAEKKGNGFKAANYGFGSVPPLWSEENRSSMNQTLFVRLEPSGLERLIKSTKSEHRIELVEAASELYRRDLLERWADLAAANHWEGDFQKIADCCTDLIESIQELVPSAHTSQPDKSGEANNGAADFKRRMAHELVIAWKFAPNTEAKKSIANALKNSGIRQIGEPSEMITMDGGLHRCDGPAFPGDKVEVVESGWLVHDGVGEFLLEKAIVKII